MFNECVFNFKSQPALVPGVFKDSKLYLRQSKWKTQTTEQQQKKIGCVKKEFIKVMVLNLNTKAMCLSLHKYIQMEHQLIKKTLA